MNWTRFRRVPVKSKRIKEKKTKLIPFNGIYNVYMKYKTI
jgi:hypothetical protein